MRSQETIALDRGSSQAILSTERNVDTLETEGRQLEDDFSVGGTTTGRRKSANKSVKPTRPQQLHKQTQRQGSKQGKHAQGSAPLVSETEPVLGGQYEQTGEPQKVDGSPAWDWAGDEGARQASLPSNLGPWTSAHARHAHPVITQQH